MSTIQYITERIPEVNVPAYDGESYDDRVPDTLDLAERARLAVNGLTEPTDPEADFEIYWRAHFRTNPPKMHHSMDDQVQVKFWQALPLMRLISAHTGAFIKQEITIGMKHVSVAHYNVILALLTVNLHSTNSPPFAAGP